MSDEHQQAVADGADAETKSSAEADAGARVDTTEDLDALLSEYNASDEQRSSEQPGKKPAAEKAKPGSEDDTGELRSMVKQLLDDRNAEREKDQKRQLEADLKDAVKVIRGEVPSTMVSDLLVEAWMDAAARKDPRLAKAWLDRRNDPKKFGSILEKLSRDFAKEFSKRPDPQATEDKEAVAAAVKGASTQAPAAKDPDYKSMSNADFASDVEKKHGFRPLI